MFVNLKPNRQSLTQGRILNPYAEGGRTSAQTVHGHKKQLRDAGLIVISRYALNVPRRSRETVK